MARAYWKKLLIDHSRRETDVGFDVNALNNHGKTILSYAVKRGNLEVIEFLVMKGADGNIANSDGLKPLHIAAKYGHKDIVKFFLSKGISANSCDYHKCTALHYIAKIDFTRVISRENYQDIVHLLVDNNGDLNAVNREGYTPLLLACKYSRKDIAELLIELGAKVDCYDEDKWTALHYSSCRGWTGIVQTLMKGKLDIDLNERTLDDNTPLLLATNSSVEMFELLFKGGASVFDTIHQLTVLHYSCLRGWLSMVKYLVNSGCDINAKDNTGRTPLVLANKYSHCSVVEYLIESGANLEDYDDVSTYPILHNACLSGWLDVVKSLVKKGSDINSQSDDSTPLHYAVSGGHTEIIKILLEAGADCNLKNYKKETAFHNCLKSSFYLEGIILLMIENGAYFQSNDYNVVFNTPLLKAGILQDVNLCSQAVINKFNNADLPKFYKLPGVAERLPPMEKLNIAYNRNVVQYIAESVTYAIQTKGYCDLMNACPIILSNLCLASLLNCYDK